MQKLVLVNILIWDEAAMEDQKLIVRRGMIKELSCCSARGQ